MNNFLTIGQFSKATQISVKALRHYAEEGLLRPAWVDGATGYRYYSVSQFVEALRVRRLRELGISLGEIQAFLNERDPLAIQTFFEKHRQLIQERLVKGERDLVLLEKLSTQKEEFFLAYDVGVREVSSTKVMSIRSITSMKTIGEDMGKIFGELYDYVSKNGGQFSGECFDIYHDEEFNPERIDVECCFSVLETIPENDRVKGRTVEGGLMAYTLHKGPYDQLEGAYTAIMKWIEENGYVPLPKMRDLYLNGPDCEEVKGPEDYKTEILWPVKKKA